MFYDQPILFTEMGCDACFQDKGIDEEGQTRYLISNWKDVEEEWLGIFSQGNGHKSHFLRQLRIAYEALKEIWTKEPSN